MHPVDFTGPLDELVTALKAAGIRSASIDPAELNPPAALVELTGIRYELLDGVTLVARVSLVVPDVKPATALTLLAELSNMAATVLDPEGDAIATRVPLLESSAALPALVLTQLLSINPEPESE